MRPLWQGAWEPPAISGCGDIVIDEEAKFFTLGGKTYHEGDYISLDGSTGKIYDGDIATQDATISGNFKRIMEWADSFRKLNVRTNADTPEDAANALRLGAEGIGLCGQNTCSSLLKEFRKSVR